MPLRAIVLLAFFICSLPVCFFRPFYGILLWEVVAFLNPQSYIWAANDTFPWALAIAIPTIVGYVAFSRQPGALSSRECAFIVLLWGWFTVTTLVSTSNPVFHHHAEDTWNHWRFVSKVLLMTLFTLAIVTTLERLRILIIVMTGCFGLFVLKDLPFIISTGGAYHLYGPDHSMIADNNDFGLALNMTLPIYFFLAQTESKRWVRLFYVFLGIITIPAIFFTYSRGALVGLITVMALMLVRSKQRFILAPIVVLAIMMAVMFAPEGWKNRMDPTRPDAVDASAKNRLNAWAFARGLAADYPITGGGFATFTPELFAKYAPNTQDIHGPHSVYFQLLGEHGFTGLALYLCLVASFFYTGFGLLRAAKFYGDVTIANYVHMLRFSLIGFLSSGFFLGRAYFDYFFAIVACMAILAKVAHQRWAERDLVEEEEPDALEAPAGIEGVPAWEN
jgi:putative inorganic carbon (HCO3(-)) transporter